METITDHKMLSKRFTEIKDELDEAEKSLTKLLGRGRSDIFPSSAEYKKKQYVSSYKTPNLQKSVNKRPKLKDSSESEEESGSEDEHNSKKIALRSAVTAKVEGNRSRRDIILKQNCNTKIQSRNRRMFGMVQSTLRQFQDEAVKRQSQDLKRIKVEQKVEAAEEEEKQLVEKQKIELFSKRKEKQLQLDCLQKMMLLTESFEVWENNQKHLLNFILTEAEPKICFLPASHTPNSKKHHEKSQAKIRDIMKKQKTAVEKELAAIKESHQSITPVDKEVEMPSIKDDNYNTVEQKNFSEESLSLHLSEDELIFD